MSHANLEKVTRTYEAWRAGGPERALRWMDPEIVWTALEDAPDAGVYRGHAGVLAYMNDWLRDFEDLRMDFEDVVETEDCVVAVQRGRGRGKGSGIEVDLRYAAVYDFRSGKLERVREFRTKELALQAAGLC
ncbi:MAG: DUF4440 domain-containing protein [Solirubrobacterales bacterium]|nr:DUF4440 domain-containing protein [Solirubrobacterales bacterium]